MSTDRLPDSGRLAGILTTAELGRAGYTQAKIRTLLTRGVLVRSGQGLYALAEPARRIASSPGGPSTLRVAAAIALTGATSVGSHAGAAQIHGLDLLRPPGPDNISVTRSPSAPGRRTGRQGIAPHLAALPDEHRTVRFGVPVTSVARTVVDLARTMSFKEGVVVADSALRGKQVTKDELRAIVGFCARWQGVAQARRVVEFSDGLSESVFESISRTVFHDAGLPPPELQVWLGADGTVIGRVDFLWRRYATIAEADGAVKYADPERARMQLRRDADLREAGFDVVHFTWQELHLCPDQVVRSIRAAFERNVSMRAGDALRSARVLRPV